MLDSSFNDEKGDARQYALIGDCMLVYIIMYE